jgi:enoyl-CoA hydratase/carnithine racemase
MVVANSDIDGIRVVTIDNPSQANALDAATFEGLGAAFADAAVDASVRVIVLTAVGDRAFCSGASLKGRTGDIRSASTIGPGIFTEQFYEKPIVAAVNGVAVGGGLGLVLACDIVVAARHARFGIPEVQRGLVGVGVVSRAASRLNPSTVLELALTGELIDSERALALGLVNRVVEPADLMPTALAIARLIRANGPLAVRATKAIVHGVAGLGQQDLPALRAQMAYVAQSKDAAEGIEAFRERRPPVFTGE